MPEIIDKVALHHMAQMSDIVIISEFYGRVLNANERFYSELGYTREDVTQGRLLSHMLYEHGKKEAAQVTRALIDHRLIEHHRTRLHRSHGGFLDVELTLILVGERRSDSYIIGINKNIGALAQLLTEIGKVADDKVLTRLVRNPQDTTMILTDPHGRILYCNHTTIDMLGFELREVINRPVAEFYQDGTAGASSNLRKALRSERWAGSGTLPQWFPSVLKSKDGDPVSVDTMLRIYRDTATNEISSVLGVNALPGSLHKCAFISHSTADKPVIRRLCRALENVGVRPWLDERSIPVSRSIPGEISDGVLKSDYFIFCASPDSVRNAWCMEELDMALMQEKRGRPLVIPVMVRSCTMPPSLKHRRYADLTTNPTAGLLDLLEVVRPDSKTDPVAKALRSLVDDRDV